MPLLTFLGIGAAYCPELGNTAAYFFEDHSLYLLDCGGSVFPALMRSGALARAQSVTVMITHTHADHVGSLGTLVSYCQGAKKLPVTIVHPQENLRALLALCGIAENRYAFFGGEAYADDRIRATFIPVFHSKALPAYGILISDGSERVYYSGDAGGVPPDIWARFLAGDIARLYEDAAYLNDGSNPAHGAYAHFLAACPEELRARFYPIHWDMDLRARIAADGFGLAMMK